MKVFICCSKAFYDRVAAIQSQLEAAGHEVILPNSFDDPLQEEKFRQLGDAEHASWKREMLRLSEEKIRGIDALLILNFNKNDQRNYIGGATFLEMFKAFELGKKIYLYNPVPDGILKDEILGMDPLVINVNLNLISEVAA